MRGFYMGLGAVALASGVQANEYPYCVSIL
jgi:hypothetical protein